VLQKRFCGKSEPLAKLSAVHYFNAKVSRMNWICPPHKVFGQPSYLAFPDHVHSLVALNRPPRSLKRSEALAGVHPALDRSMVLLHNIVQVRAGATPASALQFPFLLQFPDHFRIRRIAVDRDDSRPGMTGSLQGFLKESFGRSRVTLGGKPKVDRGAAGIDGTI
jgi:hypothetical protein